MNSSFKKLRLPLVSIILCGTLMARGFHDGKTQLTPEEQGVVLGLKEKEQGFEKVWKAPGFTGKWQLLKWDGDHSWAVPDAPGDLLDHVREEVGRVNQTPGEGENLYLSTTVYRFKKQGLLTNPVGYFELVARDRQGKAVWIALDHVKSTQALANSMADSDSQIMGRELYRKIREEFSR